MSQDNLKPSSRKRKAKSVRTGSRKKSINPDKLLSDINQQTEALNNIIKKFGESLQEKDSPKKSRNSNKSNKNKS